jgi:hypothetical protein
MSRDDYGNVRKPVIGPEDKTPRMPPKHLRNQNDIATLADANNIADVKVAHCPGREACDREIRRRTIILAIMLGAIVVELAFLFFRR